VEIRQVTLTGRLVQISISPSSSPTGFYRVQELPAFGLGLQLLQPGVFTLSVNGQPGNTYTVQTSSELDSSISWSDLFSVTLTNSTQRFPLTNSDQPSLFFRVKEP